MHVNSLILRLSCENQPCPAMLQTFDNRLALQPSTWVDSRSAKKSHDIVLISKENIGTLISSRYQIKSQDVLLLLVASKPASPGFRTMHGTMAPCTNTTLAMVCTMQGALPYESSTENLVIPAQSLNHLHNAYKKSSNSIAHQEQRCTGNPNSKYNQLK